MTPTTIFLDGGGSIDITDGVNHITIGVRGPLNPGASPVAMSRAEAEGVVKALTSALARLRGADAMADGAEPLTGALDRPRRTRGAR